jgi:hypothetical protein
MKKNIYPEFENDPKINLTKEDILEMFDEIKEISEKWFWVKMTNG